MMDPSNWLLAYTPRSLTARPWKMMVGRLLSFWDGFFSGVMLNFLGVLLQGTSDRFKCRYKNTLHTLILGSDTRMTVQCRLQNDKEAEESAKQRSILLYKLGVSLISVRGHGHRHLWHRGHRRQIPYVLGSCKMCQKWEFAGNRHFAKANRGNFFCQEIAATGWPLKPLTLAWSTWMLTRTLGSLFVTSFAMHFCFHICCYNLTRHHSHFLGIHIALIECCPHHPPYDHDREPTITLYFRHQEGFGT